MMKENFKFKDLKVYANTEWLYDNRKMHRQVFDRYAVGFLYFDLSLHNCRLGQLDWELEGKLICVTAGKKQICEIPLKETVTKDLAIFTYRQGWGNKKLGTSWVKGKYSWQFWIADELISATDFYIEEIPGAKRFLPDAYLSVTSIRLYEGPNQNIPKAQRKYLDYFDYNETRFVYVEIIGVNLNQTIDWVAEITAYLYNQARSLKGQVQHLTIIKKGQQEVEITFGWGSEKGGVLAKGHYSYELVFLDQLIGRIEFKVIDTMDSLSAKQLVQYLEPLKVDAATNSPDQIEPYVFDIPVSPTSLATVLHQYLICLANFIQLSTGEELIYLIRPLPKGLRFIVPSKKQLQLLHTHMEKYLNYAKTKGELDLELANSDQPQADRMKEVLKLRVEQQVFNLDMELKYEQLLHSATHNEPLPKLADKHKLLDAFREALYDKIEMLSKS